MEYEFKPVDTSKVHLPPALKKLTERLAENVHNVWARQRVAEGWRYGPERNDHSRQHPSLVPYEQLPESEKAYDRGTAVETLKMILALGYTIGEPPSEIT